MTLKQFSYLWLALAVIFIIFDSDPTFQIGAIIISCVYTVGDELKEAIRWSSR